MPVNHERMTDWFWPLRGGRRAWLSGRTPPRPRRLQHAVPRQPPESPVHLAQGPSQRCGVDAEQRRAWRHFPWHPMKAETPTHHLPSPLRKPIHLVEKIGERPTCIQKALSPWQRNDQVDPSKENTSNAENNRLQREINVRNRSGAVRGQHRDKKPFQPTRC